mmetsp:Transcript_32420/g.103384  ORF Transcript_32420/g.103384 Transcript_32420/m.103384 type:complete len:413 (-) Transcript_32420:601-1839(-)
MHSVWTWTEDTQASGFSQFTTPPIPFSSLPPNAFRARVCSRSRRVERRPAEEQEHSDYLGRFAPPRHPRHVHRHPALRVARPQRRPPPSEQPEGVRRVACGGHMRRANPEAVARVRVAGLALEQGAHSPERPAAAAPAPLAVASVCAGAHPQRREVKRGRSVRVCGAGGRAELQQCSHYPSLRRVGRLVQRLPANLRCGGHVGTCGCQLPHACVAPGRRREVQRRAPGDVPVRGGCTYRGVRARRRACRRQPWRRRTRRAVGGGDIRVRCRWLRRALAVLGVWSAPGVPASTRTSSSRTGTRKAIDAATATTVPIDAPVTVCLPRPNGAQQQPERLGGGRVCRSVQRRGAGVVPRRRESAGAQEQPRHLRPTRVPGQHQWPAARPLCGGRRVGPVGQQQSHRRHAVRRGGVV